MNWILERIVTRVVFEIFDGTNDIKGTVDTNGTDGTGTDDVDARNEYNKDEMEILY